MICIRILKMRDNMDNFAKLSIKMAIGQVKFCRRINYVVIVILTELRNK